MERVTLAWVQAWVLIVAVLWFPSRLDRPVCLLLASLDCRLRRLRIMMGVWVEGLLRLVAFALRIPSSVSPFRSGCA
jgi:hypothetical protein